MIRKIVAFVLLSILCISCNDEDPITAKGTEIIFGEVYGLCVGDCRSLYLLTPMEIFEDSNTDTGYGNWGNTTFEDQALPENEFETANALLNFPADLLDFNGEIGTQVISDFDYFIEIKSNDVTKTWLFDEANEDLNVEIKSYIESVISINNSLKN